MQFNKVTLVGRLTRDPELRSTSTGKNVVKFAIAVNKRFKPRDGEGADADFFDVSAWGQTAEYVNQYATKGRLAIVDGRIESRKFTDRDGNERTAWEVTADTVTLLDRPRDDEGGGAPRSGGGSSRGESTYSAPRGGSGGSAPSAAAKDDEYDPFGDA